MAEQALAFATQVVPAERVRRYDIRARVRDWARRVELVPPIDLETLRALAAEASHALGIAGEHLDFVTVLLSNAAWESEIAAAPLDRRLLLLPQCLRAPERCQAPLDGVGLACLRCGACSISTLEAEAEALGYHVLVAEGTSAAARLVESGRIQAVVAVACLHSLERSFSSAAAGAIPALVVPLLDSGCRATRVDLDWIRQALRTASSGRRLWHFHLDRLRATVTHWFERDPLAALLCRAGTESEDLACQAVACGGKRWRPTLTAAVHQALCWSDATPPEAVRRVAVAVECFHKASLVHDDIEDGDVERNGRATLHASHGLATALNVGDLLIGEGYRLIAEAGLSPEVTACMLGAVARAQRELCLGQGQELAWTRQPRPLTRAEALMLLQRKTSPAFEVGLLLGAMAAGADDQTCHALRELSAALGLAYQIRDDIEDQRHAGQAEPPSPLFVALASEEYGEAVARRLANGELPDAERSRVLTALEARAWPIFERYRAQGLRALRPITHHPLKSLLFRLVYLFLGIPRHVAHARAEGDDHGR